MQGIPVMKITKDTMALDALRMSGSVIRIFQELHLSCPGCKEITRDTIEKVALCNGLDLGTFVEKLNDALK